MKEEKIILAFVPIFLLLAMISMSATAPIRQPGVTVGNMFKYGNLSFTWSSNNESATPPPEWKNLNETEWFSFTVQSIVGTNVTCSLQAHYLNGTDASEGGWIDVETGDNDNMTWFLIAANLNSNDSIYTMGDYSTWTINETIQKTYNEDPRDTNHINMTMEASEPPFLYANVSQNYYWDKATGVITELSVFYNETINFTSVITTVCSVSIELTESSVWVVPEFSGLPQTLLLIASLTLVTLASKRKLLKTRNH
jgi:hypothetical protein